MNLSPSPKQQFFGNNGRPLDGGLLFTYIAGTNTKIATYQNASGTPNTNPIVLDFRGEANIWLDPAQAYKFVLSPRGDTDPPTRPIWSVDNIEAGLTASSLSSLGTTETFIGTGSQTQFTLLQAPGIIDNCQVFTDGLRLVPGVDFTLSGRVITFTLAPYEGAQILVSYGPVLVGFMPGFALVTDFGAKGDGVTNDVPAFNAMLAADVGLQCVPFGDWRLDSDVVVPARDISLWIDPDASFSGAGLLKFDDAIPFQHDPTFVQTFYRKTYGSSFNSYWDAFLLASMTEATGTARSVAMYSRGNAAANGARAWGSNAVGSVTVNGGIAIGIEVDCQIIGSGNTAAQAYGVVIAASGDLPCENAIQIQASNPNAPFRDGIRFDLDTGEGNVTQALFRISGASGVTCERLFYATAISATNAEIDIPSFAVLATQPNTVNRVSVRGSATGAAPRIQPNGTDANINLEVRPKGTAAVQLLDSSGNGRFSINGTGIGFFGATPAARPTYGAPTGTATRTTFDTATVTLPQLAERVKAMIDDNRTNGYYA